MEIWSHCIMIIPAVFTTWRERKNFSGSFDFTVTKYCPDVSLELFLCWEHRNGRDPVKVKVDH